MLPCRADKKQTAQRLKKQVTSLRHQISGMGTAGVTEVCDVCVSHHGKMNHSPTSFIISYNSKQHCVDFLENDFPLLSDYQSINLSYDDDLYMSYSIMKRVHSDVLWHLTHFVLIDYLCDHSYCKYNGVQNFEGVFLETGRFIFFTLKMLSVSVC